MNINTMRQRQSRPSVARVYSYVLGGRDHYGVDKDVGDYFKGDLPGSDQLAITNRHAVRRAVSTMAKQGIRQFIDIGCGLPDPDNSDVHQVARAQHTDAHIVYVDNDPFVAGHGRALLAVDSGIAFVEADASKPEAIREHPDVKRLINFDEPVGILFAAVLSFLEDEENPSAVVRYWAEQVPTDSLIYISHFRSGETREAVATERKIFDAFGRGKCRPLKEIEALFGDLEPLDDPAMRPCADWRPDETMTPHALNEFETMVVAGIARKR